MNMDKPAMKLYEACNNLTRLKLANPLASYSSTGRSHHLAPEQPFFPRERSLRAVLLCSSMLFFCFNFYEFLHLPLASLCLLRRPTPQKWQIRLLTEHRVTHWLSRANPLQFWKFEHLEREREKKWKGRKKAFHSKVKQQWDLGRMKLWNEVRVHTRHLTVHTYHECSKSLSFCDKTIQLKRTSYHQFCCWVVNVTMIRGNTEGDRRLLRKFCLCRVSNATDHYFVMSRPDRRPSPENMKTDSIHHLSVLFSQRDKRRNNSRMDKERVTLLFSAWKLFCLICQAKLPLHFNVRSLLKCAAKDLFVVDEKKRSQEIKWVLVPWTRRKLWRRWRWGEAVAGRFSGWAAKC